MSSQAKRRPSGGAVGTTQARSLKPEEVSALKQESDRLLLLEQQLNGREHRLMEREAELHRREASSAKEGGSIPTTQGTSLMEAALEDARRNNSILQEQVERLEELVAELQVQRDAYAAEVQMRGAPLVQPPPRSGEDGGRAALGVVQATLGAELGSAE
eukprot:4283832-Prymnesium_polylepis.1